MSAWTTFRLPATTSKSWSASAVRARCGARVTRHWRGGRAQAAARRRGRPRSRATSCGARPPCSRPCGTTTSWRCDQSSRPSDGLGAGARLRRSGGSLAAVLAARGRLSAGEVVTIGAPLAQALADIHARGVSHGDITPANIVFDGSTANRCWPISASRGWSARGGPDRRATPGYADPALAPTGRCPPASPAGE